ncbi:hypothetical protein F5051DRAFT_404931, partial [Lentinula edodes]
MRFYAVLTIVSVLASVLAAPRPQFDRGGVSGQISPASPYGNTENYSPVSPLTPTFNSNPEANASKDGPPPTSKDRI